MRMYVSRCRQKTVAVPGVLFGRREPQGPGEPAGQPGQRDHGVVPGQPGLGAEPVVREGSGAAGVRRVSGRRAVRHDHHSGRAAAQ